jgi:hypothetical protein
MTGGFGGHPPHCLRHASGAGAAKSASKLRAQLWRVSRV